MKKILYSLAMALCLGVTTGCEQNETPVYDTAYTALNLWFGSESSVYDYTTFNYSYYTSARAITFYGRVMGAAADHDRTFTLEAVDGNLAEAAGTYTLGVYTVPAGETTMKGEIVFDSSKLTNQNAFSTEDTEGSITFRMVENSVFHQGAKETSTLTVMLRNYLSKPDSWDNGSYYELSRYFGTYSKVKYQFIIEHTGLVDFKIAYQTMDYDPENNSISTTYANYLIQVLATALAEYNATHDKPLTDETGQVITF